MIAGGGRAAAASAAAVVLLLCACRSVPSRLFTLEPVIPASSAHAYPGPPIRIDAVHIPPALDRIEIMNEIAPGEFGISDVDRWAAPLGQLTRQALSADLIARLPPGRVIYPNLRLQASWTGHADGAKSSECGGIADLRAAPPGAGSAALASAFGVLLGRLADGIAADLGAAWPSCL
jgi:hypothetical protein